MERGYRRRILLIFKKALPLSEESIQAYITAWKSLYGKMNSSDDRTAQRSLFEHMYYNLDILDSKTSTLLQFNAILIAVYGFILPTEEISGAKFISSFHAIGVASALLAIILSLRVIWVHWSGVEDLEDEEQHILKLISVRNTRTIRYRRAWALSMISVLVLISELTLEYTSSSYQPSDILSLLLASGLLFFIYIYDNLVLALRRFKN